VSKMKTERLIKQPKVSIIVVSFNGKEYLQPLIKSLKEIDYKNFSIIIVDNNSEDGSQEILKKMSSIIYIENKKNFGLAEGTNIGLRKAIEIGSEYLLVMNPDMIVKKDFLEILVEAMKKHPEVVVCGPKINYMQPHNKVWCAGCKYRIQGYKPLRQGEIDDKAEKERHIDALDCTLMFRREALKSLGLLDSKLFIIHELTGWCLKATQAGYKCLYVPDSLVWHKVSASLEAESNKNEITTYYSIRNWLLLVRDYKNFFYFLWVFLLEATLFATYRFMEYLNWKKPRLILIYYKALWHGLTNKTQKERYDFKK